MRGGRDSKGSLCEDNAGWKIARIGSYCQTLTLPSKICASPRLVEGYFPSIPCSTNAIHPADFGYYHVGAPGETPCIGLRDTESVEDPPGGRPTGMAIAMTGMM